MHVFRCASFIYLFLNIYLLEGEIDIVNFVKALIVNKRLISPSVLKFNFLPFIFLEKYNNPFSSFKKRY